MEGRLLHIVMVLLRSFSCYSYSASSSWLFICHVIATLGAVVDILTPISYYAVYNGVSSVNLA